MSGAHYQRGGYRDNLQYESEDEEGVYEDDDDQFEHSMDHFD